MHRQVEDDFKRMDSQHNSDLASGVVWFMIVFFVVFAGLGLFSLSPLLSLGCLAVVAILLALQAIRYQIKANGN